MFWRLAIAALVLTPLIGCSKGGSDTSANSTSTTGGAPNAKVDTTSAPKSAQPDAPLAGKSSPPPREAAEPVAGGLAAKVVGKWKMDPSLDLTDPPGTPVGFMKGFASTFWYEFKKDKTFSGSMSEGTYALKGTSLEVTTLTLTGQETHATKPQMTGKFSADGKHLTLYPPDSEFLKLLPKKLQHGILMAKEGG